MCLTMKDKVVFITHSRITYGATLSEAGHPPLASTINREAMNSKTKQEETSNLANVERNGMQPRMLRLSRASKSPNTRASLLLY